MMGRNCQAAVPVKPTVNFDDINLVCPWSERLVHLTHSEQPGNFGLVQSVCMGTSFSFQKYLWSAYCVPDNVLERDNVVENKADRPLLHEAYILEHT